MKTARLSPAIVAAVGIVLSLLAVALIFFLMIKPTQDNIAIQQARLDAAAPGTDPDSRTQGLATNKKTAQAKLAQAKVTVQQTQAQWAQVEAAIMPPFDVSDRFKAFRQLTYELNHVLAPDLQRQLATTGVTSTTRFAVPLPPTSPNDPMIRSSAIEIPLGTVTVNGDFRHILNHFNSWQYFNRLVKVDGLTLTGNSPYMQGSYNATVYLFPQHDTLLKPPLAKAGGAAGATGSPGGGGAGAYPGGGGGAGAYPGGAGAYPGGGGGSPYPGGH